MLDTLLEPGLGESAEAALALVFGEDLSDEERADVPSVDKSVYTYTPQYGASQLGIIFQALYSIASRQYTTTYTL